MPIVHIIHDRIDAMYRIGFVSIFAISISISVVCPSTKTPSNLGIEAIIIIATGMKPIIAIVGIFISIIVVLAILIASGVFNSGILDGGSGGLSGIGDSGSSSEDKIPVTGGPMASLQSIATGGNALTTPDISHTAVYGYYLMGVKIGSISFTNIGEEYYEGER